MSSKPENISASAAETSAPKGLRKTKNVSDVPVMPGRLTGLAGLVVAFGWPLLYSAIPGLSTHRISSSHDDLVTICTEWLVAAIFGVVAFSIQQRTISDFGIRGLGWRDVLAFLGGVVIALILSGTASRLVAMPSSLSDVQKLAAVPLALRIALVLTAAICEEFIFRGYGIETLTDFTRHRGLAALLSWALFTVSHSGLYSFSAALIIPGVIGAILTIIYVWRRNLISCMLMHSIIDGIFIVLIPALA